MIGDCWQCGHETSRSSLGAYGDTVSECDLCAQVAKGKIDPRPFYGLWGRCTGCCDKAEILKPCCQGFAVRYNDMTFKIEDFAHE